MQLRCRKSELCVFHLNTLVTDSQSWLKLHLISQIMVQLTNLEEIYMISLTIRPGSISIFWGLLLSIKTVWSKERALLGQPCDWLLCRCIRAGAVANLRGCGKEAASVLFWVHIFAIFSMAGWIILYFNILF